MAKKAVISFNKFCRIAFNQTLVERFDSGQIKGEKKDYILKNQKQYRDFKLKNRSTLNLKYKEFTKIVIEGTDGKEV